MRTHFIRGNIFRVREKNTKNTPQGESDLIFVLLFITCVILYHFSGTEVMNQLQLSGNQRSNRNQHRTTPNSLSKGNQNLHNFNIVYKIILYEIYFSI